MWYNRGHENTDFYPPLDPRRTRADPSRIAFVGCFCLAPLPDFARQCPRRAGHRDCQATGLRRPSGSQCDPWLQCHRVERAAGRLFAPPSLAQPLFRGRTAAAERPAAPQSARFWPRVQHLDALAGGPGEFRAGPRLGPHLRRNCASSPQAAQNQLEAGQALDDQPRPAVSAKKNARDRLIAWASLQTDWAIGFLDEVWWSRFALPRMHAWQDEEQAMHLVEQSWKKGDPDPKA